MATASRLTSLANKKTLININEPAIYREYWSEDSSMQQPSLKHLTVNVRYNNNALTELNDCIGSLLHLGLNVVTFRTSLNLGSNVITSRTVITLRPSTRFSILLFFIIY